MTETPVSSICNLPLVDQEEDSPYSGGVMITRDDDVYFITRNPTFLGFHEATETQELLPFVPMKIEALCGQQIRGSYL